jgi:hypothetical protein
MSEIDHLKELKSIARKLAKVRRIKHAAALQLLAQHLGYTHWHAVTVAEKKGWRPDESHLAAAGALLEAENPMGAKGVGPLSVFDDAEERELLGRQFVIATEFDDVVMVGDGWEIRLPEAPSADPEFYVTDKEVDNNAILDRDFVVAALNLALDRQEHIHARIAADWPRRSTVPYPDGRAQHPLTNQVSTGWFCLHCDTEATSQQMVDNLWHCPTCNASPIDTFASRWWLGKEQNPAADGHA